MCAKFHLLTWTCGGVKVRLSDVHIYRDQSDAILVTGLLFFENQYRFRIIDNTKTSTIITRGNYAYELYEQDAGQPAI